MFCILFVYLLLYVPYMQNFKKMHACDAAGCCWRKIGVKWHGPFAPKTGISFGNFIYTTIVYNDTPLSQTISIFKT